MKANRRESTIKITVYQGTLIDVNQLHSQIKLSAKRGKETSRFDFRPRLFSEEIISDAISKKIH